MYGLLVGNFALHAWRPLPIALHVFVSAAAVHLAFTVWHEAVHRNVSPRAWVNTLVGVLGMFPYMTPYFMQRWIHLQHHARLNEREDPNFVYVDGPFWASSPAPARARLCAQASRCLEHAATVSPFSSGGGRARVAAAGALVDG
jgi:fatty acid desaturase